MVRNIGDEGSLLNWTIESYPSWGEWTCTPSSGVYLSPDDGPVTVGVTLVVPEQQNTIFEGHIKVVNQDNSSDVEMIHAYVKTQRSYMLGSIMSSIVSRLPILQNIISKILYVNYI